MIFHRGLAIVIGLSAVVYAENAGPKGAPAFNHTFANAAVIAADERSDAAQVFKPGPLDPANIPPYATADDGTRFTVLRYGLRGSVAGVRVQFTNFHLPEGATVWVYGENVNDKQGPYTASGPTNLNEFWTAPVSGNIVNVELQITSDVPSTLPFDVAKVAAATSEEMDAYAAPLPPAEGPDEPARTSMYHGVEVAHEVRGGLALVEGDILLGNARDLQVSPMRSEHQNGTAPKSFGIVNYPSMHWPGGVVPYVINGALPTPSRVTSAVTAWNNAMGGVVRFVPRTSQSNYINFVRGTTIGVCSSYIGMIGGAQAIYVGDSCSGGNLIHEMGHALGLFHEHTRIDRDRYVTINWSHIQSSASFNFNVATSGTDIGSYDFGSIMHYPAYAFSSNGLPTIVTKPAGIAIGQRTALSAGDIAGVKKLYGGTVAAAAPAPAPTTTNSGSTVAVTFATNPPGLKVVVNGTTYSTPATLSLTPGSPVSVSAQDQAISTLARFTAKSWSNGSGPSFTYSVPSSAATLTANFTAEYMMQYYAGAGGTVTMSPVSADWFYPANTVFTLNAVPDSTHVFSYWQGLAPGTPANTTVTLNIPRAVRAIFVAK